MTNNNKLTFEPFKLTEQERREMYREIQTTNINMFYVFGVIDENEYCRRTEIVAKSMSWYFIAEVWLEWLRTER